MYQTLGPLLWSPSHRTCHAVLWQIIQTKCHKDKRKKLEGDAGQETGRQGRIKLPERGAPKVPSSLLLPQGRQWRTQAARLHPGPLVSGCLTKGSNCVLAG